MFKKVLATGLMLTVMLSASACGKDSGETSGTAVDTPAESSAIESQPTEEETESSAEEEASVSASYIFSDMPIAAYELKGLGIGLDVAVNEKNIIDPESGYDYGVYSYVKLTPGENTFILYCFSGGEDSSNGGEYGLSIATIHSPTGSSPWVGNTYSCLDAGADLVPEGYSWLEKYYDDISEEECDGEFVSLVDPWHHYIRFTEIFHADAPQPDTIYAIEVETFQGSEEGFEDEDNVISKMVASFEERGATVQEISVEEALARDNIIVTEGVAN